MPKIPSRRLPGTLVELPEALHLESDSVTADDVTAWDARAQHAPGFAGQAAWAAAQCNSVLIAHGGRPHARPSSPDAMRALLPLRFWHSAGWLLPEKPAIGSPADFALRLLALLRRATRVTDPEEGKLLAWQCGALMMDAYMSGRWGPLVAKGERMMANVRTAALAKAQKARSQSRSVSWAAEVERAVARGQRKTTVMALIERRLILQPGTVKRAISRLNKRK